MSTADVTRLRELPDPQAVLAAASAARATDGVAPLGEAFELALTRPGNHRLITADGTPDGAVLGYAGLAEDGSAEALVVPDARRRGLGRALVQDVLDERDDARLWAHGDLPAARALAATLGLEVSRELLVLARPLTQQDASAPDLPDGVRVRPFVPGQDDTELLAVNAAAFADHPEQGALDQTGLDERMGLDWFDPAGLLLLVEGESEGEAGREEIVGFHWTKVEDGVGEVYVVGVRPDHQGRGLAGPLTRLGLAHLAGLGLGEVELYVEGDNAPALATYGRVGFVRRDAHVMYSRAVQR